MRLNADLGSELQQPLRIGIGLHLGPAIVGVLGHGPATGLTAIGATVNTARRLESQPTEPGATLVASQAVWDAAGPGSAVGQPLEVPIRGRTETLAVRAVADLATLPS